MGGAGGRSEPPFPRCSLGVVLHALPAATGFEQAEGGPPFAEIAVLSTTCGATWGKESARGVLALAEVDLRDLDVAGSLP